MHLSEVTSYKIHTLLQKGFNPIFAIFSHTLSWEIPFICSVHFLFCLFCLYKFKKVGKQLYAFLFALGVILSLLMGDSAQGPISYVIDGLGWANTGAILTLLYFSPIKKEF